MSDPQPEIYTIFCLIVDEDVSFSVDIANDKTVDHLKKLIKEENKNTFANIDAKSLKLYDLEIDYDEDMANNATQKMSAKPPPLPLPVIKKVADVFKGTPKGGMVHSIVEPPTSTAAGALKRKHSDSESRVAKRIRLLQDIAVIAPSSATAEKVRIQGIITNNRQPLSATIPLALLGEVFGKFMRDMREYEPTQEDNQFLFDLWEKMVQQCDKEEFRCHEFREVCLKYGLKLTAAAVGTSTYRTDGDLRGPGGAMLLVTEGKNEWHGGNTDLGLQVTLYYVTSLRSVPSEQLDDLFPCLLIYYVGSFIGFAGCVFADSFQVELLTPFYPFNTNYHETGMSLELARALGALRLAVPSLKRHYAKLQQRREGAGVPNLEAEQSQRLFYPYKRGYSGDDGVTIEFTYLRRMFKHKLLFLCEASPSAKVCVKFTRRYSEAAHRHCTDAGMAPRLHAVEKLPGGWIMVVMEYLDEEFYETLSLRYQTSASLLAEVSRVVAELHLAGFVHGDIRDVNLMMRREWSETKDAKNVMLVDFDWTGVVGEVRYPPNVNAVSVNRPDGAKDGNLITKEHDQVMVARMFDP